MEGFPFALIHRRGEGACGGVAFYLRDKPKLGDMLYSANARLPDGTEPAGQRVHCSSCGMFIPEPPMIDDVE
jgi:hypothetical protein